MDTPISRGSSVTYAGFPNAPTDPGLLSDVATNITRTTYVDSSRQVRVVSDGGVTRLETYTASGRVHSVAESAADQVTRNIWNFFDAAGQLRAVQDAGGGRSYHFYDERGNRVASVDSTGSVPEFDYDSHGRIVRTLEHAERADTSGWLNAGVAGTNRILTIPALGTIRPGWTEDFADATVPNFQTGTLDNPVYTGLKRDASGRLVLQRAEYPSTVYPNLVTTAATALGSGPMYRMEVSTGSSISNLYGFFGLHNAGTGGV